MEFRVTVLEPMALKKKEKKNVIERQRVQNVQSNKKQIFTVL